MKIGQVLMIGGVVAGGAAALWMLFRRPAVDQNLIMANSSPSRGVTTYDATFPTTVDEPPDVQAAPPPHVAIPPQQTSGSGIQVPPVGPKVSTFINTGELAHYLEHIEGKKLVHPSPLDIWVDQYVTQLDEATHIVAVLEGRE